MTDALELFASRFTPPRSAFGGVEGSVPAICIPSLTGAADAFLALPGGLGTFDELFEVLTMRNLGRHGKPIALLDYEGYWRPAAELIRNAVEKGFAAPSAAELFGVFDRAEECLDYLEREAGQ